MKQNRHILIVGLGNPGADYDSTRHNIGFYLADKIAEYFKFPQYSKKFDSLISSSNVDSSKVTILKPQSFMNLSGYPVYKAKNFYKIELDDVFVLYDDLDLQFGKIKIKIGGGSGGHNGIKSIDQNIGSDYHRVRFGIGKPSPNHDVSNYVLSRFSGSEMKIIEKIVESFTENFNLVIKKDIANFMNKMAMENKKHGL